MEKAIIIKNGSLIDLNHELMNGWRVKTICNLPSSTYSNDSMVLVILEKDRTYTLT